VPEQILETSLFIAVNAATNTLLSGLSSIITVRKASKRDYINHLQNPLDSHKQIPSKPNDRSDLGI